MKDRTFVLKLTAVFSLFIGLLNFSCDQLAKGAGNAIESSGEGIQNSAAKHS